MIPVIIHGDAQTLPLHDGVVQTCMTSPPYYGLRRYAGLEGAQLGAEASPDCLAWARQEPSCGVCYICRLRVVFAEAWRVLRDDGTLWVNIRDSYNAAGRQGHRTRLGCKQQTHRASAMGADNCRASAALPSKSLIGIPQRLALALQADGWVWRSEVIWHKPNGMPESVKDRLVYGHEQVLLFAKSQRYYFDQEAEREACAQDYYSKKIWSGFVNRETKRYAKIGNMGKGPDAKLGNGASPRSVWTIPTEPSSEEHYAAFPRALARKCLRLGASLRGRCPHCGTAWVRVVEKGSSSGVNGKYDASGITLRNDALRHAGRVGERKVSTIDWQPACACPPHEPMPCVVADIFAGSGTTCLVAQELGMQGIGVELSAEYAALSQRRLRKAPQLALLAH